MSYLQCTLLDLLLRFSLLLVNGRRVESGPRFKGRTQDDCQCRLELRSHVYSDTHALVPVMIRRMRRYSIQ